VCGLVSPICHTSQATSGCLQFCLLSLRHNNLHAVGGNEGETTIRDVLVNDLTNIFGGEAQLSLEAQNAHCWQRAATAGLFIQSQAVLLG